MVKEQHYKVGRLSLFIKVDFEKGYDRPGEIYVPWLDKLKEVHFQLLECIEEKTVKDNGPKHEDKKGFVFVDDCGNTWYNQYPEYILDVMNMKQYIITNENNEYMIDAARYLTEVHRMCEDLHSPTGADIIKRNYDSMCDHLESLVTMISEKHNMRTFFTQEENTRLKRDPIPEIAFKFVSIF